MKKVKLGFIGAGCMGQLAHLQYYSQLFDDCEIAAVADVKSEQVKKVAEIYGSAAVFTDYRELLDKSGAEAVVVSVPCTNHAEIVAAALNAGKHVLTDPPVSLFARNAEASAALAKEKGLVYMLGYNRRSDPAVEFAVEHIKNFKSGGKWGRMKYVRITAPAGDWRGGSKPPYLTDEPGPDVPAEARPEAMYDDFFEIYSSFVADYIHQANLLRHLMQENYKVTYVDSSGMLMAAESEYGITGLIELEPYTTTYDWQEKVIVCFERANVEISLPAPLASQQSGRVSIFADVLDGGATRLYKLPSVCSMKNQALNFIKAVRGEKPAVCGPEEAILDLEAAAEYTAMYLNH